MLHVSNIYVQSFKALRTYAAPVHASNPYQMVIRSSRRPTTSQAHCCNRLQSSEIAAIIFGAEGDIFG